MLLVCLAASAALRLPAQQMSRRGAIGLAAATALPGAVHAGNEGTKNDKAFTECLSKCLYEQTKIAKGIGQVEVVSRQEAYAVCKPKVRFANASASQMCHVLTRGWLVLFTVRQDEGAADAWEAEVAS